MQRSTSATTADREATELGVEREVPLIRSVLARALLARGDIVGAAGRALAAIDAASSVTFEYPIAICLETAPWSCGAGYARIDDVAQLLSAAAFIRERGARPAPLSLRKRRR